VKKCGYIGFLLKNLLLDLKGLIMDHSKDVIGVRVESGVNINLNARKINGQHSRCCAGFPTRLSSPVPGKRMTTLLCLSVLALGLNAISISAQTMLTNSGNASVKPTSNATTPNSNHCYDANDPDDIRLWPGDAPGAVGTDPCKDIPFLHVFRAANPDPRGLGIITVHGGSYVAVSDTKELGPVGYYFSNTLHVTTFVLYYRLVQVGKAYGYPIPEYDAQRAIRLVRSRAAEFGIDPNHIGLFGFSGGGHLATSMAVHSGTDFGLPVHDAIDYNSALVNFLGLGYPVEIFNPATLTPPASHKNLLYAYSGAELSTLEHYLSNDEHTSSKIPSTFLFESKDDTTIPYLHAQLFYNAMLNSGKDIEYHLYEHGTHGTGLATDEPEEFTWPGFFQTWLANLFPSVPAR